MPSLAPTLTCITWHTQATLLPLLSLCIFFSGFYFILVISLHLELVQDSVSCNTATAATSPRACTGYPFTVISPFWGTPAAPLHPPLCALWVDMSHHHSLYLVPPLKKKVSLLFPSSLTSPLHTHPTTLHTWLQKDNWISFSFFLFPFSSQTGAGQWQSQHHCCPLPSCTQRPPLLTYHHTTCGMQANLPPYGPVTHATHQPHCAQCGCQCTCYPNYIASTSTQPPVATITSTTSTLPPHHPLWAC